MPTVPTFAVRETDVSWHNVGASGAPLKPLRDDSVLRALSSLWGLRGAPAVPPLCRETQSLGQQMLNATVGINGLTHPLQAIEMVCALSLSNIYLISSKWLWSEYLVMGSSYLKHGYLEHTFILQRKFIMWYDFNKISEYSRFTHALQDFIGNNPHPRT